MRPRRRAQFSEDIVALRVVRLITQGVKSTDARALALEQLRAEMAQQLREREARGDLPRKDKRDDHKEDIRLKYDGVDFAIATEFEATAHKRHKKGSSSKSKRKRKQKVDPYKRFGE